LIGLVLAAAGGSSRFKSNTPKQFNQLRESPVYCHALELFAHLAEEMVVVVPEDWREEVEGQAPESLRQFEQLLQAGSQFIKIRSPGRRVLT